MKLTAMILLITCLQVSAEGFGQDPITLNVKDADLISVFAKIKKQTGFVFWYRSDLLVNTKPVTINVKNAQIQVVLNEVFKDQPLSYTIKGNAVFVNQKTQHDESKEPKKNQPIDIRGRVVNERGDPVEGVTIRVKGSDKTSVTDANGEFEIITVEQDAILLFSHVSMEPFELKVRGKTDLAISLKSKISALDEMQVIAYGMTSKRFNTGNVATVKSIEIGRQPVSNPLATLQGRVPGMIVTQSTGLPGAGFDVQIRGRNSINNGNDPLYVIDGIPITNKSLDQVHLGNMSQQSPLNSINTQDIESIEVLKDADATSIYGSRGANGVILITTKKGKSGKTSATVNISKGWGKAPRVMEFMNTQQYVEMRNEAFKNDNRAMTQSLAYDLLVWDTTRYTDWQKLLIGGTSDFTNAQATLSGGNAQTQFLLGGNCYNETTVFPGDLSFRRGSGYLNLSHSTNNKKFTINATVMYSGDRNKMIRSDLLNSVNILPNSPFPYDENGNLTWSEGGFAFNNPLGALRSPYTSTNQNMIANLGFNYRINPSLVVKLSTGYTNIQQNQVAITPKAAQNPSANPSSSARFGSGSFKSYIIEPNVDYQKQIGSGRLEALLGTSFQQEVSEGTTLDGTNYSSEALLNSIAGAGSITSSYSYSKYRYQSVFGRIKYNYRQKYILNITGRTDGSSRFGSEELYHTFGAIGGAWLFAEEKWIKSKARFLSYGKLRMSYGTSGNDKIGDYNYLDTWQPTASPYQGAQGLRPFSLYNPDYAWEINRKLEFGLEIGLLKDKIYLSVSHFRNRSSNQLVQYALPAQTGFASITRNLPAVVENIGNEFLLNTTNIKTKDFEWASSINITIAKNKLIDFPDLETSSYANTYIIGRSLNIVKALDLAGVNSQTGAYEFNGTSLPKDQTVVKDLTPEFYGGFSNTFTWKNLELSFLFQFIKQENYNYGRRNINGGEYPGRRLNNHPIEMLERWQKVGDEGPYQIYTTGSNTAAVNGNLFYAASDAVISDASFIRLKNASLSYQFSSLVKRWGVQRTEVFMQAQNLFTLTDYFGFDPENQGAGLPPLRVINVGLKLSF